MSTKGSTQSDTATGASEERAQRTEVAIIGAGIVGLFNALQFAKRGIKVVLIDDIVNQKRSYKVGESLLVFSATFLRTVGGLDDFITNESVPKSGVWFIYGGEGKSNFDDTTEWALERTLGQEWKDAFTNKLLYRAAIEDAQIVRPEAEDVMTELARAQPNITFLDTAKVRDARISHDRRLHTLRWESRSTGTCGSVEADWVVDCSGRTRFLAKRLNHTMDDAEISVDGFQTTCVWAQFSGIDKEMFGKAWEFHFADGKVAHREGSTVHLWGEGYWMWVINLSKGRISIGVTYNQKIPPPGESYEEQFWNVIRRYPVFDKMLLKENVLEFRVYKNVQYMTDTFVSPNRYGMVGDASSIIDAYYSQGMSHSFLASWHLANIVEEDLRQKHLNLDYIDRVNESLRQDWRMVRNMVRGKFTPAIADSRFFLLSHLLDMNIFIGIGAAKHNLTRWLVETDCATANENAEHTELREYVQQRGFYSKLFAPLVSSKTAQVLQAYCQRVITERALWRLQHGVEVAKVKSIVRYAVGAIPVWRVIGKPAGALVDISPDEIKKVPKFLLFTGQERAPITLKVAKVLTAGTFLGLFTYDWAATSWVKAKHMVGMLPRPAPDPVAGQPAGDRQTTDPGTREAAPA